METPNYIKSLLIPSNGNKPRARRVWGIDLELVWLPFFLATNTMGDTAIPADALGAPLRLGYNADGSVKFSKTGRPVTRVARDIADSVRLVRDNFTAGLLAYAKGVITDNPDGYSAQVETAKVAGEPIQTKDRANLDKAVAEQMAEAVAEAERKAKAEARAKSKAKVEVTA
jgi:hypothetical protein